MKTNSKGNVISKNDRIIINNTFFAFIIKGGGFVISLLTTPAFIKYFNNNEILGVWYTLLSVLIWFLNFDLGIGNGIRNSLVNAFAKNDRKEAKYIISSGIFSISILTLLFIIIGIISLKFINLNSLFSISVQLISRETLFISAVFVFIAVMMRFMLTTVSSIFYALQKSAINNFLSLMTSILQLLFVLIVHIDNPEKSLIVLSISYMVISNLPVLIAGIIIFFKDLKDCRPNIKFVNKNHIQAVLKIGGIFFFCQILYMLIVNTNEFLITKLYGPEFTTTYTFYYKITSVISIVVTLAMTPIWSVVTKAVAENDWAWVQKLYKKIKLIGFVIIVAEFCIIPFLQIIMNIWLGSNTFIIDYKIALAFACFGSVFVYSSMLSTIVCGMGRMKLQAICYAVGVVFKFIFIFIMSNIVDSWGIVVWSNFLLLLPYCVLQHIDLNILIKHKILRKGKEYNNLK